MSGHRVELRVTFTVGADEAGREAAEGVYRSFTNLADHGQCDDFSTDIEVHRGEVDGNPWHEKWPPRPKLAVLAKRTPAGAAAYMADVLESVLESGADERALRTVAAGAVLSLRMLAQELEVKP